MILGSVTDGNSSEKTAKLLSEIRSIIRLQKCLSTIFLLKDGGEKCNEKCDAEQELLSSRLDDFESKTKSNVRADRVDAHSCRHNGVRLAASFRELNFRFRRRNGGGP